MTESAHYVTVNGPCETGTLSFPLPPNIGNSRWHWRTKNKLKKYYFGLCSSLLDLGVFQKPEPSSSPGLGPVRAKITFYCRSKMDRDNQHARLKWVLDWLTQNNYIVDDREEHFDYSINPLVISRKKGDIPYLTIELSYAQENS